MKQKLKPLHFAPIFRSVIWGGDRLGAFKGVETPQTDVGESWEVSGVPARESVVDRGDFSGKTLGELCRLYGSELLGERVVNRYGNRFPLLVKLICTADDLSVQVHPDDLMAATEFDSLGKTELWYIIDAAPGATIISGLKHDLTPSEFDRLVTSGRLMNHLERHDSRPGDVFMVPAGRIHAIGKGNMLLEIQEASDLTFRIFDYNRRGGDGHPRELHLDHARRAMDFKHYDDSRIPAKTPRPGTTLLAGCEHFKTSRVIVTAGDSPVPLPLSEGSFAIAVCVDGCVTLSADEPGSQAITLPRGDSVLIPACVKSMQASGDATLIVTTC